MNRIGKFRIRIAAILICALMIQSATPAAAAQIKVSDTGTSVSSDKNNSKPVNITVSSSEAAPTATPTQKPAQESKVTNANDSAPASSTTPAKTDGSNTTTINISKPTAAPTPTPTPTKAATAIPTTAPSSSTLSDKEDRAAGGGSKYTDKKEESIIDRLFGSKSEEIERNGADGDSDNDTTIQNSFDCILTTDKKIVLTHYKGSDTTVIIPSQIVSDNIVYTPVFRGSVSSIFGENTNIEYVDISNVDTSQVNDMSGMFKDCRNLKSVSMSGINTSLVSDMSYMFNNCYSLNSVSMSGINTGNVGDMSFMFNNCNSLSSIDLASFNTGKVTDMKFMFHLCTGLTSLNLENFETSQVTDMTEMFCECLNLTDLNIANFRTGNVTSMANMFNSCIELKSIDVSKFDTTKVSSMHYMFASCAGLTSIDVSKFNTGKVTLMEGMFSGCSRLTSIDVSKFNTGNVTNMENMFSGCSGIKELDLSGFNTAKVASFNNMLSGCSGLDRIEIPLNLTKDVELPGEFIRLSDHSRVEGDLLPKNQTKNDTIVRAASYVSVNDVDITGEVVSSDHITIYRGRTYTLSANVTPENATVKDVTWSVSDNSIISLTDSTETPGIKEMKGLKNGTTGIKVVTVGKDKDNRSIESVLLVTVIDDPLKVTSVTLDRDTIPGLQKNRTTTLTATVHPDTAENKDVEWSIKPTTQNKIQITNISDDTHTATIKGLLATDDNGVIVEVTTKDGRQVSQCKVNVIETKVTGISVASPTLSVNRKETLDLDPGKHYTVNPDDASNKAVTFVSDHPEIATVDPDSGLITGIRDGEATITITSKENPNIKNTIKVTVKSVPVKSLHLNKEDLILYSDGWIGETERLVAEIVPSNPTDITIEWRTTSANVVAISPNGRNCDLTPKELGTSDIYVKVTDKTNGQVFEKKCHVTVEKLEVHVTGIDLKPPSEAILVGNSTRLEHTIIPANASDQRVTWSSDDPSIATVTAGLVTGISPGTTTIRVKARDGGYEAYCTVIVRARPVEVESVELNHYSYQMYVDEDVTLIATPKPENASDKTITWKSNNTAVATVTQTGHVKAVGVGEAIITATASNGVNATCLVKVIKLPVRVKEMYITPVKKTIYVGQSFTITATVLPADADIKDVIWNSDNDNIATVNAKGKVTGKKKGTAIITAVTADGGITAQCEVTVNNKPVDPTPTPWPYPTGFPGPGGGDSERNRLRIVDERTHDAPNKDKVRGYLDRAPGDWYLVITDSNGDTIKPRIYSDSSLAHNQAMFFKIRMLDGSGNEVKDFGKFTIRIPLISEMDLNNGTVRVVAVNGDGLDKSISSSTGKDGDVAYVTFTANHNGEYAILYTLNQPAIDYNNYYRTLAAQYMNALNAANQTRVLDHVPRTGYGEGHTGDDRIYREDRILKNRIVRDR